VGEGDDGNEVDDDNNTPISDIWGEELTIP
jgi:hypothetical protein